MGTEVWALLSCLLTLNPELYFVLSFMISRIAPFPTLAPRDTPLRYRQRKHAQSLRGYM